MFRRAPGPMIVAALTGIVSGVWIFKPMLDGSFATEHSVPSVVKQDPSPDTLPGEPKTPTK